MTTFRATRIAITLLSPHTEKMKSRSNEPNHSQKCLPGTYVYFMIQQTLVFRLSGMYPTNVHISLFNVELHIPRKSSNNYHEIVFGVHTWKRTDPELWLSFGK